MPEGPGPSMPVTDRSQILGSWDTFGETAIFDEDGTFKRLKLNERWKGRWELTEYGVLLSEIYISRAGEYGYGGWIEYQMDSWLLDARISPDEETLYIESITYTRRR
uniref:Uncharacterized protein n=1 Tax=viral metagenome TaxID=1070528 RepID=A0A6M3KYX1_9ZZZZ